MKNSILLILSIILGSSKSAVYNNHAKKTNPDTGGIFAFNAASSGIALLVIILSGGSISVSPFTVFCAVMYALIVLTLQTLSVFAMKSGSMSIISALVVYGLIIPALAGPVFWKEPLNALQIPGIILIFVSFFLLKQKSDKKNELSGKWLAAAVFCFIFSGLAGLMEKVHQTSLFSTEKSGFLFTAYAVMFLFSLVITFIKRSDIKPSQWRPTLLHGVLSGVIMGFYCRINLTLAGTLKSLVYYPVSNAGGLLLTFALSVILFKEKFTKTQLAGFIIGLAAIILLSI